MLKHLTYIILTHYGGTIMKLKLNDITIYALCIITIIICVGYYTYVQNNLDKAIEDCNDSWKKMLEENCVCGGMVSTEDIYNGSLDRPPIKLKIGGNENGE